MDIDTLVNEKLEADVDFQAEIESLSDDEKSSAIEEKRKELVKATFNEVHEKATKNEELAKNYKTRAEKAEKERKEKGETTVESSDLSSKDLYAMMEAKVPQEDVDEVVEWAKFKKITVAEALKSGHIKTLLSDNAEIRKSADVTTTGTRRAPTGKISDEAFLKKIESEGFPEAGTPEAERLFDLRHRKN